MSFFLMGAPNEQGPPTSGMDFLILPLAIFLIFWLLVIRPQRKQEKTRQDMLQNLKKGDQVTTSGGIIGKVLNIKDNRVVLKIDENSNTKATFVRTAIAYVHEADKDKDKDKDKKNS